MERIGGFDPSYASSSLARGTNIPIVQWIRIGIYEISDMSSTLIRDTNKK